jgi:23S rRNA (guanosine2251-2'-O)-methyltransferase
MEALKANRAVERVLIARGAGGQRLKELIESCRQAGVPVRFEDRSVLDRLGRGAAHQGVIAVAGERRYAAIEEVTAGARLLVVLDGVEDPHNLGAIIRTAHAAGASAVVIPERRAAPLTPVVAKSAAGALEHLPVARVTNVTRSLEQLKKDGFWIYGLDERGEQDYDRVDYNLPTVMVAGAEGKGLHEQVKKHCDVRLRIPMAGKIASLNVSVAVGVVLFDWRRRAGVS